jgi:hypothetical protein
MTGVHQTNRPQKIEGREMPDLIDLHAEIASLRAKAKAIRAAMLVDLQAEIASLQAEAEAIRAAEIYAVVDELRTTMAAHGINPADLGTKTTRRATKKTRLSVRAEESLAEQVLIEPGGATPALVVITDAPHSKTATAVAGPALLVTVTPEAVATKVATSDGATDQISDAAASTSGEEARRETKARVAAYNRARRQAKKLEKLASLQAQTIAAAAAVEPAEVENVVPPTKKPFDSWAFIASMYKTPKDLQETLDKMTPRQIARAQRRFRPSLIARNDRVKLN